MKKLYVYVLELTAVPTLSTVVIVIPSDVYDISNGATPPSMRIPISVESPSQIVIVVSAVDAIVPFSKYARKVKIGVFTLMQIGTELV